MMSLQSNFCKVIHFFLTKGFLGIPRYFHEVSTFWFSGSVRTFWSRSWRGDQHRRAGKGTIEKKPHYHSLSSAWPYGRKEGLWLRWGTKYPAPDLDNAWKYTFFLFSLSTSGYKYLYMYIWSKQGVLFWEGGLTTDSTLSRKTVPFTFNTHAIFSSQEFYNLKINLDACILLNSCFWVWHKATFYSPIWKLNITANAKTRYFEDLVKIVYF